VLILTESFYLQKIEKIYQQLPPPPRTGPILSTYVHGVVVPVSRVACGGLAEKAAPTLPGAWLRAYLAEGAELSLYENLLPCPAVPLAPPVESSAGLSRI
jgi:hypothetical protein